MNEICKLHCHIAHAKGKKSANKRGYDVVSVVIVRFGSLTLGSIKLMGKWREEQALKEWEKDKSRFTLTEAGKGFLNPVSL